MTDIKIGGLYEDKGNYRFKVLCVDGDDCFIRWLDEYDTHGVLSVDAIHERCKPYIAEQTDCPWK